MMDLSSPRLMEVASFGSPDAGKLAFFENGTGAPFALERVYWTFDVPHDQIRGHHAHRELHQLIFAVAGRIEITLENLRGHVTRFELARPHEGLYVPPVHWRTLTFSPGAVMMCLASAKYDETEYIRSYDEFKSMRTV